MSCCFNTCSHLLTICFSVSLLAGLVNTQTSSQNVAYWTSPRANLLGNKIYINGGDLFVGNAANSTRIHSQGAGALWELDLTLPRVMSQDLSILGNLPSPDQNEAGLFYVAGAMFANYNGLMTYGGMSSITDLSQNHGMYFYDSSSSAGDLKGSKGVVSSPQPPTSQDPSTWYVCCGADVSALSENLAFYYSGLASPSNNSVPINYETLPGDAAQANTPSDGFIMCNTSILAQPICERLPWPSGIDARAESGLVWLPYGAQGMLLAMGGIAIPSDMSISGLHPVYDNSNDTNNYMTSILVYDVFSGTWEVQQTDRSSLDSPATMASFCTVVATAPDNQSHHIYVYGGYDGTYVTEPIAYDTVWVLSIPAFRWTKISEGLQSHRRQNHKCIKTSPSQFFSIGGNTEFGLPLNSSYIDVFDMNNLVWNSSYDPTYWSDYIVPTPIKNSVGDVNLIPENLVPQVQTWLSIPYNGTVRILWPHTKPSLIEFVKSEASWWLGVTVAVLAYLTLASCALIAVVCLRRRMVYRSANLNMSDMTSKSRIVRWMHNAPAKTSDSMGTVTVLKSPEPYTDSVIETYVDEERSEHITAPGPTKPFGTQVSRYEPLTIESNEDIELNAFTHSIRTRT